MNIEQWLAVVLDPDLLERYGPRFVDGLLVTAKLVAISFTLGAVLGLLLALARLSRSQLLQRMSAGYVYFFRGSPLLAQLFLLYYGLGSLKGFWQDVCSACRPVMCTSSAARRCWRSCSSFITASAR